MDRITIQDVKRIYEELPNIYYNATHDVAEYYRDYDIELHKENGDYKVYQGNNTLYFCNNDVVMFVLTESGTCYKAKEYFEELSKLSYIGEAIKKVYGVV